MAALRRGALALTAAALLTAQSTLLQIQVIEGEGAVHLAGSRVSKSLTVRVTEELGNPVKGAIVSFRLPEEGPSGLFANGLNTEVVTTGEDGRAWVSAIRWNRLTGPFHIRVAAVRGESRAGTAVSQSLSNILTGRDLRSGPRVVGPRASLASRWRLRSKWVVIGLLAAGAAGAGFATGWARQPKSEPSATLQPVRIGSPTISIGKP